MAAGSAPYHVREREVSISHATPHARRVGIALTVAALAVCYASVIQGMFDQWLHDEDMGHGMVVPIVILWIVWKDRRRWVTLPLRPSWWGLALLAAAACIHFTSRLGAGLFAGSIALMLSSAGAVLRLGGFAFLRIWAFPFLLALFMLPKLAVVYNQATLPLQLLAGRLAEAILLAGGVGATRSGDIIDVGGHSIAVAEACNGIRYLLPLAFVAVVFAYLCDVKPWMRTALLAASIPIAIIVNAVRVAVSAAVPALDSGAPHALAGALLFVLCLAALELVRRLLNAAYAAYHD